MVLKFEDLYEIPPFSSFSPKWGMNVNNETNLDYKPEYISLGDLREAVFKIAPRDIWRTYRWDTCNIMVIVRFVIVISI